MLMSRLFGVWIFDVGAGLYDFITANEIWQANCARLLEHVPRNGGRRKVLDLGTGPAVSAVAMGQHREDIDVIGFDLSKPMLAIANRNRRAIGWSFDRLSLLRGDVYRLPFADRSVDVVTAHSFLYLFPHYQAILFEVNRVLKNGGYISFLEPHQGQVSWSWLWQQGSGRLLASATLWRFYSGLHRRFSHHSLRSAFEQTGFANIVTECALGGFGVFGHAQKP